MMVHYGMNRSSTEIVTMFAPFSFVDFVSASEYHIVAPASDRLDPSLAHIALGNSEAAAWNRACEDIKQWALSEWRLRYGGSVNISGCGTGLQVLIMPLEPNQLIGGSHWYWDGIASHLLTDEVCYAKTRPIYIPACSVLDQIIS